MPSDHAPSHDRDGGGPGLPLDQAELFGLWEREALPDTDFLCTRVEVGTGFLGMKRITKNGVVAIKDGELVIGGDGSEIVRAPVTAVTTRAPAWLGGKVVYADLDGRRYGLGLTLGTVLVEGERPVIKRSGALQGASDAARRFRQALAAAQRPG
jgi:hypothetical protein